MSTIGTSRRDRWDQRYADSDLVWGLEPNQFVARELAALAPSGRALDVACGEGRNVIWLARRGWRGVGVDFSSVAIDRARKLAASAGVDVELVCADITTWRIEPSAFALVVIAYLQLPSEEMQAVFRRAAEGVAPGGELFAIGHAVRNLDDGVGGPPDRDVLWNGDAIAATLREAGLEVGRAEEVLRAVEGSDRSAIDTLVRAHRPQVRSPGA